MKARHTFSRIYKLALAVMIAGFALAILRCRVDAAAEGGGLFYNFAWAAFQILRPAILAVWHHLPAYFCDDSTYLQRLPQVVSSIWPLAGILAG
ncbi:MAG TPA: hypothetical protein VNH65_20695 [Candidatus Acidoferrum sp.]|nr:hypothetical protein [Candidatus Acidoferrum sp.]